MPIPGEYWINKEDCLHCEGASVYVTGVDMEKGLVFFVRRSPGEDIRGETLSESVGFWNGVMEKLGV